MSKTLQEIQQELDQNIPEEAVQERDAGYGMRLSYLAGWYVINRLNKVFGQGNWSYALQDLVKTFEGKVNDKFYVSYTAKVELSVKFPQNIENKYFIDTLFTDVGFGDGQDKANPGKAHELAVKEAVTDGIKRCAKSLGMSMGLALYDKTKEFVGAAEIKEQDDRSVNRDVSAASSSTDKPKAKEEAAPIRSVNTNKEVSDYETIKKSIKTTGQILSSTGKITIADFKSKYLVPNKVTKVDALTPEQAVNVLNSIQNDFKDVFKSIN